MRDAPAPAPAVGAGAQPERRPGPVPGGRIAALAWSVALTAVLLAPQRRSGYGLGYDMVFTPRLHLTWAALGAGSVPPRAVPLDALVGLAGFVVDGAVIGRVALVAPLLLAGYGMAALLGFRSYAASLAAVGAAVWNPYVVERLALGQWALLWSYAALPWLVVSLAAGATGRCSVRTSRCGVVLAVAAASITPTGGLIAWMGAVVLGVGYRLARRDRVVIATAGLLLQLPWIVAALVSTAATTSDPRAVGVFASRADGAGGPLLSLLTGGGIWNADAVPGSRSGPLTLLALAVVVAAAVVGVEPLRTVLGRRPTYALAGLAGAGLILAVAASIPGVGDLVRWVVQHVPGAGLLRDAQKWVAPLVVLEALLIGLAADRAHGRLVGTRAGTGVGGSAGPVGGGRWAERGAALVAALTVPLLLLPDAAATLRPTMGPVHYPADWTRVAGLVRGADAVVVPFASYRRFSWAPGRSVLDPAPRLLRVTTVVEDRLVVSGRVLAGESRRADQVRAALTAGRALPVDLAAAGIGWVVVEYGTPGAVPDLSGLTPAYTGTDLGVYRVPGPVAHSAAEPRAGSDAARATLAVGYLLAAAVVILAAAGLLAAAFCAAYGAGYSRVRRPGRGADTVRREPDERA